ncbi:MAG: hypothetical protein H6Q67_1851 [Firmicutes bacterium]|nr:hypothetical protein [Bacillota bacterium]
MAEKRTSIKLRTEAKDALKDWNAEKIESMYFDALNANPSTKRIVYPDGVSKVASIAATNTMSCAMISKAKRKAKKRTTYTDSAGNTCILPKIRPIKVNGKSVYIMILTEEQMRDLRNDSTVLNVALTGSAAAWAAADTATLTVSASIFGYTLTSATCKVTVS